MTPQQPPLELGNTVRVMRTNNIRSIEMADGLEFADKEGRVVQIDPDKPGNVFVRLNTGSTRGDYSLPASSLQRVIK